jgi:hypothetical protein
MGAAPCDPRLFLGGSAARSQIRVLELKARGCDRRLPAVDRQKATVTSTAPSLGIALKTARVRAEQHTTRCQCVVQRLEYSRQQRTRNVKQRCIGEDAFKAALGQSELEEALLEHLTTGVRSGHRHKLGAPVQTCWSLTERTQRSQVAPRPTPEVEDAARRAAFEGAEQRSVVLRHVVVTRALPKRLGMLCVVRQRPGRGLREPSLLISHAVRAPASRVLRSHGDSKSTLIAQHMAAAVGR